MQNGGQRNQVAFQSPPLKAPVGKWIKTSCGDSRAVRSVFGTNLRAPLHPDPAFLLCRSGKFQICAAQSLGRCRQFNIAGATFLRANDHQTFSIEHLSAR